jgi:hypothetical protein
VEEHAIAIGKLSQALSYSDLPDVALLELADVELQQCGQSLDFLFVDPDVARRSRTAVAATGAFES